MHQNPAFRKTPRAANLAFAAARGFGQFIANGPDGPLVGQAPFELTELESETPAVFAHLLRSNPLTRLLSDGEAAAVLTVSGADAYISPNWYGDVADQVPTWNYVAVHLRGRLRLAPRESLRAHLERLSARFEEEVVAARGGTPWRIEKMSADALSRMERGIAPVEFHVDRVEGTWKVNQNKTDDVRLRAAAALEDMGADAIGSSPAEALARLMRDPPVAE